MRHYHHSSVVISKIDEELKSVFSDSELPHHVPWRGAFDCKGINNVGLWKGKEMLSKQPNMKIDCCRVCLLHVVPVQSLYSIHQNKYN